VAVYYTGKLLNGIVFDSLRTGEPFKLEVGVGQVIPGWDEALLKLSKGDRATIIIPSPMAYGSEGIKQGESSDYIIPPNAPLMFDIEIVDVKK
jgi:FKBP-type peptidyl-prolyl cis-trans isomerase